MTGLQYSEYNSNSTGILPSITNIDLEDTNYASNAATNATTHAATNAATNAATHAASHTSTSNISARNCSIHPNGLDPPNTTLAT
jgi:hypothetical protein